MFSNREQAGKALAERLVAIAPEKPVVLALPRGGLPVAAEIAAALDAPLGLLLVRKVGVPYQPELAAGAVINGDEPQFIINHDILRAAGISEEAFHEAATVQLEEIARRRALYYRDREPVDVSGKTAIVVDDGIATGATVKAGLKGLRLRGPGRIILAVPVAPAETLDEMRDLVDEIVCLDTPAPFFAIGCHYADFGQLTDEDVVRILQGARQSEDDREKPEETG
jgi:putative phosphoribosyl transferase